MAQGKQLPDIDSPDDLDEVDLQILAAYEVDPDASTRDVADKVGCSHDTVWKRIRRIRKSDWVDEMRRDLRSIAVVSTEAVKVGVTLGEPKDRASIALRLLNGLGVLVDKSENVNRNIPATVDDLVDSIHRLGTKDQDALRERIKDDSGSAEGPSQPDA